MDKKLLDINGIELKKGNFLELNKTERNILAGPIRYDGFACGMHSWSISNFRFISSSIASSKFEILNWKRWRKPEKRLNEFLNHLDNYKQDESN